MKNIKEGGEGVVGEHIEGGLDAPIEVVEKDIIGAGVDGISSRRSRRGGELIEGLACVEEIVGPRRHRGRWHELLFVYDNPKIGVDEVAILRS